MKLPSHRPFALSAILLATLAVGCSDRDPTSLEIARAKIDPVVFDDAYSDDVYFQAFFQTNITAVEIDSVYAYNGYAPDGARSLKVHVAPEGSALGLYSGGVLTSVASRDMADFNALTFYARSDSAISLDVVGFGNDNTGTSLYEAGRGGIPLTREWKFVVIPIPDPAKLIAERGMFTFAEGLEETSPGSGVFRYPNGYNIWFDEIRFAKLGNITIVRPQMNFVSRQYFVGSTVTVQGTSTVFDVDGGLVGVSHSPGYFDFVSSNTAVATVTRGRIRIVGVGDATITATEQGVLVNGSVNLTAYEPPSAAAESPTVPAGNVISLFSDVYDDVPVDTWRANWGGVTTQLEDYVVAGNNTKMYSAFNYVGIEFRNPLVDASDMTYFHLDVYAPVGEVFRVKLVSFPVGSPGSVETKDLALSAGSTPAFQPGVWSSLEIPLTDFEDLGLPETWDWARIGQLVLSTPVGATAVQLVLVDNVYWHN